MRCENSRHNDSTESQTKINHSHNRYTECNHMELGWPVFLEGIFGLTHIIEVAYFLQNCAEGSFRLIHIENCNYNVVLSFTIFVSFKIFGGTNGGGFISILMSRRRSDETEDGDI
jgi:hypothetical protein